MDQTSKGSNPGDKAARQVRKSLAFNNFKSHSTWTYVSESQRKELLFYLRSCYSDILSLYHTEINTGFLFLFFLVSNKSIK